MTPSQWPEGMDDLLAKSADRGGETLAQHTWDVLRKLAALHQLRPTLTELARMPRLWHCLFWTCFLHDFGKAARGFQTMLREKQAWKQRHEVLSLACFDWIADGLSKEEQRGIVAAIVSHHRDKTEIEEKYDDVTPDPLAPLLAEFDAEVVSKLWHWVDSCALDWMRALGFSAEEVQPILLMPHDQAVALVLEQGARRVRGCLRTYQRWVSELGESPPALQKVFAVLLRGLTTTADHMASAHLPRVPAPIQESWESLARRKFQAQEPPVYGHQRAGAAHSGRSALLVAPTGSGKTEAALYWALGDGSKPVPRLFYALPYQASMNAMFQRLKDPQQGGFGEEAVGLQHGRALQALYLRLIDQEKAPAAAQLAKWAMNVNTLHARPLKVFSPYQMLKAVFQLRGFEGMLTDYAQAAFIFDEIHAYEPKRLALILALVKYLRENYQARFLVMSATFPQIIRDKLVETLALDPTSDLITADTAVFEQFRRHRLRLLPGGLLEDGIPEIAAQVRDGKKKVLACANTVQRAQDIRQALLQAGLRREQVVLIHSRFILKDRTRLEQEVMRRSEIGATSEPFVLVATQVVEVSLNIDLDTIYTDPAPLEALLQRFGRVNRQGKKAICPVHVFRQPDDGQYVYGRHKEKEQQGRIVRVTLAELEQHDGEIIDEAQVSAWLDRIYQDQIIRQQWEDEYHGIARNASLLLRQLQPFESSPQKEEQFEQLFDNVEVLPRDFEQNYVNSLTQGDFLEASNYFVGISSQKYQALKNKGLVLPIEVPEGKGHRWMVRLPYDAETGLSFDTNAAEQDPNWD